MIEIRPEEARAFLFGHHSLRTFSANKKGALPQLLRERRCIQLDPLNPLGTNADLVAMARVKNVRRGEIYEALYPAHAFEHFAKERCLLPPDAFPWYRHRAAETPWWRLTERLKRLPKGVVERVLAEIRERGPVTVDQLTHHGAVERIDWSGWKGTASATRMAVEVLWTRCQIVVCGRRGKQKLYDVPERALPHFSGEAPGDFDTWAILERVEAAGLLARAGGPTWSMLAEARRSPLPGELVAKGLLEEVRIEGASRPYLAPAGFRERRYPKSDGKARLLGPLDPLIWDRGLVRVALGADYTWEVYKPLSQRKWGWYVCPIVCGDEWWGRLDGAVVDGVFKIAKIWRESPLWDDAVVDELLARHAAACGAERVVRRKAIRPK